MWYYNEGFQDLSIYKTKIELNSSVPSFDFSLPPESYSPWFCYGKNALILFQLTNSDNSKGKLILNSSDSYLKANTNFSDIEILPGFFQNETVLFRSVCSDAISSHMILQLLFKIEIMRLMVISVVWSRVRIFLP